MPANPFGTDDPLAPGGTAGAWGGAGQGTGGYGAGRSSAYAQEDEYEEVDIESAPAAPAATKVKPAKAPPKVKAVPGSRRPADAATREAELQRREAEVARREAEVSRMQAGFNPLSVRNWPPCLPIVHHDIPNDIPPGKRGMMRAAFIILLMTFTVLLFNCICVLIGLIEGGDGPGASAFIVSIIYVIVGVPGAWILWYSRLYRAMMRDGAISFGIFFLAFLVHIAFSVWAAIAPDLIGTKWALAGFIAAVKLLDEDSTTAAILFFACGACWAALAALSILFLLRIYAFFRSSGGQQRAQQEVAAAGVQMAANQAVNGNNRIIVSSAVPAYHTSDGGDGGE